MKEQQFSTFRKIDNGYEYIIYEPKHVISGDTDSSYLDLSCVFSKDSDPDEVIEFADRIGEEVNNSFFEMLGGILNIPEERRHIISTDREAVSDKSIFYGKKKYVMHLINMEGKEVDKMKMMGVEIVKSDTPIFVQEFLKLIVNRLLEHAPYDEIKEIVEKVKEHYYTLSPVSIGKPTTIKVYNAYYKQYLENVKKFKVVTPFGVETFKDNPMKGLPYHVKSAIVYNLHASKSDIPIRAGDKIKIVYIKNSEYDAIAIPSDLEEDQLPKFLDDFEIDYDKMWEKVMKKLDLYLKPIGYDIKSRHTTHIKNTFLENNKKCS